MAMRGLLADAGRTTGRKSWRSGVGTWAMALGFFALAGCEGTAPPGTGGNVTVSVTTLEGPAAGTVVVSDPTGTNPATSPPINLPAPDGNGQSIGTATNVPPGTYRVTYTAPGDHRLDDPATTFLDVTVDSTTNDTLRFAVHAVGTLEARVTGIASGTSAGTVSITTQGGTPTGTSITLPAPSAGASLGVNSEHPTGAYRLTHSAPSGHQAVGADNTEDVTVTRGATVRGTFTLEVATVPPPPTGLVFVSNWPVAGTTSAAISDAGKWNAIAGPISGDQIAVIPATGLSFPNGMTNVLAIRFEGSTARGVRVTNGWPELADGQDLYIRFYWRMGVSGDMGQSIHPIGTRPDLDPLAMVHTSRVANEMDEFRFASSYDPNVSLGRRWRTAGITRNTTYRIELHIRRVNSTNYQLEVRMYNSAGTLVKSGADWDDEFTNDHLGMVPLPNIAIEPDNWDDFRGFEISHQGAWNNTDDNNNRCYFGGLAISFSGWIGPFSPGETVGP